MFTCGGISHPCQARRPVFRHNTVINRAQSDAPLVRVCRLIHDIDTHARLDTVRLPLHGTTVPAASLDETFRRRLVARLSAAAKAWNVIEEVGPRVGELILGSAMRDEEPALANECSWPRSLLRHNERRTTGGAANRRAYRAPRAGLRVPRIHQAAVSHTWAQLENPGRSRRCSRW